MEDRSGRNERMSLPQFGSWENQGIGGGGPNPADGYTMVFTKARADRKEQKAKSVPAHIAMNSNDNDPCKPHHHNGIGHHQHHHNHYRHGQEQRCHSHQLPQDEAAGKKSIFTYLNCCIRP